VNETDGQLSNAFAHSRDLSNNIVKVGAGQDRPWILVTVICEEVDLEIEKNGLNQSLICVHSFTPLSPNIFFYLPLFNLVAKRKIFLRRKIIEGAFPAYPPPPLPDQVTPMPAPHCKV
jgi:hypothetical protein